MATVTGFTAERMLNIENSTVVDGEVQGDNLILLTRDGTPIDAGNVRGQKGDTGEVGQPVHTGIISMYGGNTAPAGYLLCDGALVSRVTYAALFAEIGTIWGAGDGLNNFNVPNLQQRFPIGKGTAPYADVLAESGGSKDAVVVQHQHDMGHTHNTSNHYHGFDHGHTASSGTESGSHYHTIPNHRHQITSGGGGSGYGYRSVVGAGNGGGYELLNNDPSYAVNVSFVEYPSTEYNGGGNGTSAQLSTVTSQSSTHSHGITVANLTGSSTTPAGSEALSHAGKTDMQGAVGTDKNLPPYVVVNFVIKT
jgi:microcystin-dependent protein